MVEQALIPTVDLSAFATEDNLESRLASARALNDACHDLGFVQIQGHGIEPELLREAFDWSKKLYSLPHSEKMKAPHPDGPLPHRGSSLPLTIITLHVLNSSRVLTSGARESLLRGGNEQQRRTRIRWRLAQTGPRLQSKSIGLTPISISLIWLNGRRLLIQESYEIGSEDNSSQQNIWLPEDVLPGFRSFMNKFYWHLEKCARRILEAISLALNLTPADKDYLFDLHSGHNNQLRLLHYPPISTEKLR